MNQSESVIELQLNRPNLFQFATSELSQDAFLCWLMSWAQKDFQSTDETMQKIAVNFISEIFNLHKISAPPIQSIEIKQQFKDLDILAIINDEYAILIEDKTFTSDPSNKLLRYRKEVEAFYPDLVQLPIYYKIEDQSDYSAVEAAGYVPFKRKRALTIFEDGIRQGVQNMILIDYYHHLKNIEDDVNSFKNKRVEDWSALAWQGFYLELQKELPGDWGYVPNGSGGFWGFWWDSPKTKEYYLQLEQEKLCVKINATHAENKAEARNEAMAKVLEESTIQGLSLQRPPRLGHGNTMTIAQRTDYIQMDENGLVDIEKTVAELKKY